MFRFGLRAFPKRFLGSVVLGEWGVDFWGVLGLGWV